MTEPNNLVLVDTISVVAMDTSAELLHYDSDYNFISEHLALKLFAITPSESDV